MGSLQPIDTFGVNVNAGLAQKHVGEEATAHSDFAMDAPDCQLDTLCVECFMPSENVRVNTVNECAVQI
jgi:hypothetical protein